METINNWSLRGEFLEFVLDAPPGTFISGKVDRMFFLTNLDKINLNAGLLTLANGERFKLGSMDKNYRDWVNDYVIG